MFILIANYNHIVSENTLFFFATLVYASRDLKHTDMNAKRSNKQQEASLATMLTFKGPGYFYHHIHDTSSVVQKIISYSTKTVDLWPVCSARWVSLHWQMSNTM